jgi:hypothetical protein
MSHDDYSNLMLHHAEKIVALITADAVHDPALHVGPAQAADRGLHAFCPGCELTTRIARLHEMDVAKDQTAPARRYNGKSARDSVKERVLAALEREEPDARAVIRGQGVR